MKPGRKKITASFLLPEAGGRLLAPVLFDHQLVKLRSGA
jgi:hypothetical protein